MVSSPTALSRPNSARSPNYRRRGQTPVWALMGSHVLSEMHRVFLFQHVCDDTEVIVNVMCLTVKICNLLLSQIGGRM